MGRGLEMATVRLKYVNSFKDRHGHPRHYFRRNGKSVALPGTPGSPEFMDAYAAALAGQEPLKEPTRRIAAEGTFNALAALYYGSANYLALSSASKRNYRQIIDRFLQEHGSRRVDQMKRQHVISIIGKMSDKPGAAIVYLKRIRTLTRFAVELDWISVDPTWKVKSFASGEFHTWSEEEIIQFEKRWPLGTKQRLGFALHLYTGQRGSDVHRMTWRDVAGDSILVTQQKTGAKLEIPLHPELQRVLAASPRSDVAILVTEYGKAFSVKGWGQFMSAAIQKAGLPAQCKAHGLRKAAARRLADVGCSTKEIMAVTGHKTVAEVERYTVAADQRRLARQAVAKQSENSEVTNRGEDVTTLPQKAQK